MKMTKENFIHEFKKRLGERYALDVKDAAPIELYQTLVAVVKSGYSDIWRKTWKSYVKNDQKQVYYFSIEFLPGRLLKSNLLNMGWYDVVEAGLKDMGLDLDQISETEVDMALGNGGLGRLASCFMDSLASEGLPGNGNGIRYKYGLFKQKFVDGYQIELPNEWLTDGNNWSVARTSKAVDVLMGGQVHLHDNGKYYEVTYEGADLIKAVPYDTGIVGYHNDHVNTMRLWDAQIPASEEINYPTIEDRRRVEDLTSVLYPDDSNYEGRILRLKQEYFFTSAGIQSIIRHYKKYDRPLTEISDHIAIHINDTHPAMCVAEFMRILLDEEHLDWDVAWKQTVQTMSYTNHTIMAEALEKWPVDMLATVQPRILQIIEEIDRRYVEELTGKKDEDFIERTRIIKDGMVKMAHLAIIGSHSTNGVAKLHTELLENDVLHDFYELYPERFNNKTNGIAIRRWLQVANPTLSKTIDQTIGTKWRFDSKELHQLAKYDDDQALLEKIGAAKRFNKVRLAKVIKEQTGIEVSPDALFDVQIKRLHAYKRQLLNLLHIVKLYLDLKEDPNSQQVPRVFIFGAKAAPSYHYAKSIIKCINEVANLVNNDPTIEGKLKVVFLENYGVSLAEKIIPAADVSEQISTATKEASGTSNMKLMLNGALTVATLDGANIEIKDYVGDDNIFIFGLTKDEVLAYETNHQYRAADYYENDPVLHRILDAFVDGTIPNIEVEGHEIYDSLLRANDEYFVLRDFAGYVATQERVSQTYLDQAKWNKMCLLNIANAGYFSADDTVEKYATDIWQIKPNVEVQKGAIDDVYPF
ncbi:glycogen/starch/alpha-glucan phosphorylase [Ligilactobacillus apodemi]|uniref:Alpha-1,4 glucan phosphorylase n=1 Tax=Ligilactobacillus apodemi DSM 16634 = JCM 16172 TaxID=1423724 RepID=A0A0R1U493_9LACO|nr:glycogen/starch/alpha-glucan phosphorylase [Ligilactobacillus apodemi]KRL86131.1 glycogen phosphorylase [Ligilactobacillus apodemi DSM 16634 = JCM 16172]